MRIDTGCDSSAAFKALVSPPPVLSAETRSFEDVVAAYAGKLQLWCCNGCGHIREVAKAVTREQVRATGGDFAKLLPQLPPPEHAHCKNPGATPGPCYVPDRHKSSWQQFFNEAWASLKASDDHEQAMAAHSSRSIFGLV
jgi:hypothetical protein